MSSKRRLHGQLILSRKFRCRQILRSFSLLVIYWILQSLVFVDRYWLGVWVRWPLLDLCSYVDYRKRHEFYDLTLPSIIGGYRDLTCTWLEISTKSNLRLPATRVYVVEEGCMSLAVRFCWRSRWALKWLRWEVTVRLDDHLSRDHIEKRWCFFRTAHYMRMLIAGQTCPSSLGDLQRNGDVAWRSLWYIAQLGRLSVNGSQWLWCFLVRGIRR